MRILKRIIYGIMLAILLVSMLCLAFNIQPARGTDGSWWDSNWTYKRQVNLIERSGYPLTNYPVEVTFRHDGHVQPEGRDIRVIDGGSEVPYAIINLNSTHATVVFEVNITALSTKSVYIYYGNPFASEPNYPLVPLTISEGNDGYAIIDNRVHIGWSYTSWGWSNNVEIWDEFKIDFNENRNPLDDSDLIRDFGTRRGGIGRFKQDINAIGLGSYQTYIQTPIYVDIVFADAKLRIYKNQIWVETTQADFLWMFSPTYTYANYGNGTEQNIVDGEGTKSGSWNTIYSSNENPGWMAFRDDSTGEVFASTGINIGQDYIYLLNTKEASDWDRVIHFNLLEGPFGPYDQPSDCRIFWYGDNSNDYSKIEVMAKIFNNQPLVFVGAEETSTYFWLTVNTSKNNNPITSDIKLFDENKTMIGTANSVSSYSWLLPSGTYYVQALIFYKDFVYTSEQVQVDLTDYIELAINFLFGNLTVSCLDIENRPLQNCTVEFNRQDETREKYTDSFGLTTLEAYYGNWTIKAYWMGVLVGEKNININQSKVDVTLICSVGDFTVVVVDQFGQPIEANITLKNDAHSLTFSGRIQKPMENITFTQIPLIDYNLIIRDDFGTEIYSVNTEQTRQIQIEVLPLSQKLLYIIIGILAGIVIGSLGVSIIKRRKETEMRMESARK